MSSFIGHALIGSALFAREHKIDSPRALLLCFFIAGLAVSPDVDYIIRWIFHYRIQPRYTHSIGYCLAMALIAWAMKASVCRNLLAIIPTALLFLAPFSHLLLDLMVGVYPMPLFYPLTAKVIVMPFGVLPSAGKLQLTNYYLWRNLFIELGILMPIAVVIVPRWRNAILQNSLPRQLIVFTLFLCFVLLGASLSR